MRATEIHDRLAAQVEAVCAHLLPNGRRDGREWRVGGTDGAPGKSMGVHLGSGKPGVWLDGATGQTGDLIGLWMAVRGLSLHDACAEAMEYLGIQDDRPAHSPRSYRQPNREGVSRLSEAHRAWLRDERKLPDETVDAYKLVSRGERIMFPFLRDGQLIAAKYRKPPKQFSAESDCEAILFGWQAIPGHARAVIIAEGEIDACAWHAYGYPALSVPNGAGSQSWIENEYTRLEAYDTIYLSMDMDEAGQKAIAGLVDRLGRDRTKVIRLPCKDANECLMRGIGRDQMTVALRDARTMDPAELRNAAEFGDAMWDELNRVDDGIVLPWRNTRESLRLRHGELSIWAGINGHGKTSLISQVIGDCATNAVRCCVASMEWRTPVWLMRMGKQIAATTNPTREYFRAISESFRETLWTFDVSGSTKAARILEVFRYARKRYRIELFCIDNLTKCGFADDDYTGQKQFVEALADFARQEDCHVMLVAHMRKGESEDHPSGKMGVKGSGGITDMATTVIEIWRNKAREMAIATARTAERYGANAQVDEKYLAPQGKRSAGTMLIVHKQNATGLHPAFKLWYDPESGQFVSRASDDGINAQRGRPMLRLAAALQNEKTA